MYVGRGRCGSIVGVDLNQEHAMVSGGLLYLKLEIFK
jgi:hypothetical protein